MSNETPLLRRISEQEGDPELFPSEVHRLHESGKAAAARKALQKHVTSERNTARRDKQMEYAEDPYLWLEPMSGSPGLGTVNGIGLRMYGSHNPDGHGHYISVQYFTFVFIPVVPLAAYVVEDADGGGWYFLAKAPLPLFARVWQMVFAVLCLCAVGAGLWAFQQHRTHTDVLAYNAGPVAMQVQVGEEQVEVQPGQRVEVEGVPAGPVLMTATVVAPDGTPVEIDRVDADLGPHGGEDVVYNIAGLGVFATTYVQYGEGEPPEGFLLGAEPIIVVAHDYALEEPPSSISMSDSKKGDSRSVLEPLVDGWNRDQLFDLLVEEQGLPEGVDYARSWVVLDPSHRGMQYGAGMVLGEDDVPDLLERVGRLTRLHPGSVAGHRFAQDVRLNHGETAADLAREYGERAAADTQDPDRLYLHARMLEQVSPRGGIPLWEKILKAHPDHDWTHRALGWEAMEAEDPATALQHYDAFAGADADRVYEVYPMLLMLQRVADGSAWSPGVAQRLVKAGEAGETGYELARRRLLHRAAARDGALEAIVADYEQEWIAAGGSAMTPEERDWVMGQAGAAGGWQELAAPHVEAVSQNAELARNAAEWRLMLALADGGDRAAVSGALTQLTDDGMLGGDVVPVVVAAQRRVDAEAAAARVQALRERAPDKDPIHILRPDLDLRDAAAVRAAVDRVEPPQRGAAWAAIAVVLDGEGDADHPVARQARAAARTWGYPGNVPYWRD